MDSHRPVNSGVRQLFDSVSWSTIKKAITVVQVYPSTGHSCSHSAVITKIGAQPRRKDLRAQVNCWQRCARCQSIDRRMAGLYRSPLLTHSFSDSTVFPHLSMRHPHCGHVQPPHMSWLRPSGTRIAGIFVSHFGQFTASKLIGINRLFSGSSDTNLLPLNPSRFAVDAL